jgi:hypothetical protein
MTKSRVTATAEQQSPDLGLDPGATDPWKVGTCYFIRTVTMFLVGRLVWFGDRELVLDQASWIADTGRFYDALSTGRLSEIEPFPRPVIVGRGSIIDATEWTHALPLVQK